VGDKILMLADGNGEYAKLLGLELDASGFGMALVVSASRSSCRTALPST